MTINEMLRQAAQCALPRPRYAYMAPLYRQAKAIAWDYMKHYAAPIPGVGFNEAELSTTLPNGAKLELLGAQDYDYLRGRYLDGIVLDEYAYMPPEAWQAVIRPALIDRGGWAIFIGTPLGRNHFHALYEKARARPEFLTAFWPASRTGILSDADLEEARRDMTPDLYAQEFECSFEAAIKGAYYATELAACRAAGRIRTVSWEPTVPVETWWDIGFTDATAIIFTQTVGREVHCIDYLEASGQNLAWYVKELQRRPYLYGGLGTPGGGHHLPHDAEQTELGSGKSIAQQLRSLGVRPLTVGRPLDVLDGIQQARTFFARCWFDAEKCARLVDCLANYRSEWDDKRQDFKAKPYHDQWSHGADAFRYLATGHRSVRPDLPRRANTDWHPLDRERRMPSIAARPMGAWGA